MTELTVTEKYHCPHNPKVAKKIGKIAGAASEVFVCTSCRNDPDLNKFSEEMLA